MYDFKKIIAELNMRHVKMFGNKLIVKPGIFSALH